MSEISSTTTEAPAVVNGVELAAEMGLTSGEVMRAVELGVIPARDLAKGWSRAVADTLVPRAAEVAEAVADAASLGATRLAALLAERTGLQVAPGDVVALAAAGHLRTLGEYKGWPLYSVRDAEALAPVEGGPGAFVLERQVGERLAWLSVSAEREEAAERLGWGWREFDKLVKDELIRPGAGGRFALADVEALAADQELAEQVAADRLLGPDQAAQLLEIRRVDWDCVVAAGWVTCAEIVDSRRGTHRWVQIPMYRTGDVEALKQLPWVDWDEVRAVKPGKPSALREFAHRAPERAKVVRQFAQDVADRHGVEVWALYDGSADRWEMDWDRLESDGGPSRARVRAELQDDQQAAQYATEIRLGADWGKVARWARRMLEPDVAVILDTETTSLEGQIVEIAVIAADTGKKLLNTLVKATEPIGSGAFWVHGISNQDLVDAKAPGWEKVLPKLRKVTRDRIVLAYNASFDRARVLGHSANVGGRPMHLADPEVWDCLMEARSTFTGSWRWLPLGGGHRALGDCVSAREVLLTLAKGRGTAAVPAQQRAEAR